MKNKHKCKRKGTRTTEALALNKALAKTLEQKEGTPHCHKCFKKISHTTTNKINRPGGMKNTPSSNHKEIKK